MELSAAVRKIRTEWLVSDKKRDEGLTTPEDIRRFDNLSYGPFGEENLLDIYVQKTVTTKQPTIVNIHGGAWVYGSKEIYQFYCMSLAQRGFTVVNINYRLAPENRFPAAVEDINAVMHFLEKEGEKYFVDEDCLILVGDSAGGQLVSHFATIMTNKDFASQFDFNTADVKIRALGLNCGAYDSKASIQKRNSEDADDYLMEYLDCVDKNCPEKTAEMVDAVSNMTKDFPPSFVMSAVNDFLFKNADPMYQLLKKLGVPCEKKIYGTKEQEEIAHVFHVNIKLPEATQCNDDECNFFRKFI